MKETEYVLFDLCNYMRKYQFIKGLFLFFLANLYFLYSQPLDHLKYYKYPFSDGITAERFKERRLELLSKLPEKTAIILFSNEFYSIAPESEDNNCQNKNLFYLSGIPAQKAALLLIPNGISFDGEEYKEVAFLENQDLYDITWNGYKMTPEIAEKLLGIDKALSFEKFNVLLENLSKSIDTLIIIQSPKLNDSRDALPNSLQFIKLKNPNLIIIQELPILMKMRSIKDSDEIRLMQKAIDITIQGHLETMRSAVPGNMEFQLQAIMEYTFKRLGAECVSYSSIVGAGLNSCFMHYKKNRDTAKAADLVLMDCGASYHGYKADITRTFPINGKFTKEQRIIYNIVLEAQDSAIAACLPGKDFKEPHNKAVLVIQKRLTELGILKDASDYRKYFPHGTSHYLGLETHDVGYSGKLEPGNVITVEPGIYIPAESQCDKKWWNIGIRIEDVLLITDGKPVILSNELPRKAEEIEEIMNIHK